MNSTQNGWQNLLLVVFFLFIIILMPIVMIWAFNTIFGLGIAYTFQTWLAMLLIVWVFSGKIPLRQRSIHQ